ncbi:MAG: prolyl oligopeptidase family serine peptidase [Sandaracinaceae bacterium]|nr:prolyl oligopeptidase family serine peptidase [Sandaracinaceae bacterium]
MTFGNATASRARALGAALALLPLLTAWLACGGGGEWNNPAAGAQEIAPREVAPGVLCRQGVLDRQGVPMRVWLYTPAMVEGSLPLVVIGPAGSDLITGMALSEEDRPEHLPYAAAGLAVVSFDIDGGDTDGSVYAARRAFAGADFGVSNARAALDYALANEPRIDPARVYAAGHSSAATLALAFAAHEPRVHAVAAFAPVADLRAFLDDVQPYVGRSARAQAEAYSPIHIASRIRVPVFLFDSTQDGVVDGPAVDRLWTALPSNPASERMRVERGDHYGSMLDQGVPEAIRWLGGLTPTSPP